MRKTRSHIAVVDDDDAVRKALCRFLRASDMDAVSYTSGGAFLDSLSAGWPSCAIVDLRMPGLSGHDVQHYLRQAKIKIPVIVMTGYEEEGVEMQSLSYGAVAFLRKPLDDKLLFAALERALADS